MKTLAIFLIIFSTKLFSQETQCLAFEGEVQSYAKIGLNYTPHVFDTTVGQSRIIKLSKDGSLFEIGWEIDTLEMINIEYYIEKVYQTTNYNETTKKGNNRFINYLAFDEGHYPLLLMISLDQTYCYLYYYWSNEDNSFKKSEKIALTKLDSNLLTPAE